MRLANNRMKLTSASRRAPGSTAYPSVMCMKIGRYEFKFICDIEPAQNANGFIKELMPQSRYRNKNNLPLNRYGEGPFCKFKIPKDFNTSGVYTILVDSIAKYIGECFSLSSRFNMGYGNISPKNCFVGGQETNCRINNLILNTVKSGHKVSLWFMKTENFKLVEQELRATEDLEWNRV